MLTLGNDGQPPYLPSPESRPVPMGHDEGLATPVGMLDAGALGQLPRFSPKLDDIVEPGMVAPLQRYSLKPEDVYGRAGEGRRSRMSFPRLRRSSPPHPAPGVDSPGFDISGHSGPPGAPSDVQATFADMMDADIAAPLHRFSLKPEDVAGLRRFWQRGHLWNVLTRRLQRPAAPHKSYSEYNLSHAGSTLKEGGAQNAGGNTAVHGFYGLLARHIDVSQSTWDKSVAEAATLTRRSIFGLPLLHPYSTLALLWRCAMILFDITFTAFWVPLNVGFCYTNYGNLAAGCTRSDLAGGIVYVLNWLTGFQMGAVLSCGARRAVTVDGPSVARMYVLHGKFIMDSLACVPFFVLLSTISSGHAGRAQRLLSLLSLVRLVRMMRLLNTVKVVYQDSLSGHYRISWITERLPVYWMYLIILGYQFAVVVNLATSIMIMLAAYYEYDTTWYDSMPWVPLRDASPAMLWYHASYWVLTVLTTTGQGQAPRRLGEQILSNACSVYGMVFNGLVVGVVGRAMMQASGDASAMYLSRKKVGLVSTWARLRHLSLSLVKELQIYFADSELKKRDTHHLEPAMIEGLPSTLRRTVVRHIVRPLVDKVHILSSAEPELKDLLAGMFRPLLVPSGHDLCCQGEPADRLWIVEFGTVVALRHKETEAHPTTGMACLLGEGVLLGGLLEGAGARPWTLRTTAPCKLWELHTEELEPLLRIYPRLIDITLHYVHVRLIRLLMDGFQADSAWCETLALLGRFLKQPALLDAAQSNLAALVAAREEDSSLQLLLASWLEAAMGAPLEQGGRGGRPQGLATVSTLMGRNSRDQLGASSYAPFGAGGAYNLAAPSTHFFSRFGSGGGGAGGVGRGSVSIHQRMNSGSLRAPSMALAAAAGAAGLPSPVVLPRLNSGGRYGADGNTGSIAGGDSPVALTGLGRGSGELAAAGLGRGSGELAAAGSGGGGAAVESLAGALRRWGGGAAMTATAAAGSSGGGSGAIQDRVFAHTPPPHRPGGRRRSGLSHMMTSASDGVGGGAAAPPYAFAASARTADTRSDLSATGELSEADTGPAAASLSEARSPPLPRVQQPAPFPAGAGGSGGGGSVGGGGGGRAPATPSRLAVATHPSRRQRPSDPAGAPAAADGSAGGGAEGGAVGGSADQLLRRPWVLEGRNSNQRSFSDDGSGVVLGGSAAAAAAADGRRSRGSGSGLAPLAERPAGMRNAVTPLPPSLSPPLRRPGPAAADAGPTLGRPPSGPLRWTSHAHLGPAQGQRWGPGPVAESGGAAPASDSDRDSQAGESETGALGGHGSDLIQDRLSVIAHTPLAYRMVDAGGAPLLPPGSLATALGGGRGGGGGGGEGPMMRARTAVEWSTTRRGDLVNLGGHAPLRRRSLTQLLEADGEADAGAAAGSSAGPRQRGDDERGGGVARRGQEPAGVRFEAEREIAGGGGAVGGGAGILASGTKRSRSFNAGHVRHPEPSAFAAADAAAEAEATADAAAAAAAAPRGPAPRGTPTRRRSSVGAYTGAGAYLSPGGGGTAAAVTDGGGGDRLTRAPMPARVAALVDQARGLPRVRSLPILDDGGVSGGGSTGRAKEPEGRPPPAPAALPAVESPVATDSSTGGGAAPPGLTTAATACGPAALCPTCGKCTCPVCRARALAAAQAVEQGLAVLAPPRPPPLNPVVAAAAAAAARATKRPSLDVFQGAAGAPGVVAGAAAAAALAAAGAAASAAGRPPMAPWAVGGAAGGGRGRETWRRRRFSHVMDLGAMSVALEPY